MVSQHQADRITWLDVIDAALSYLEPYQMTDLVAEAQQLVQDILNGHVRPDALLEPAVAAPLEETDRRLERGPDEL